MRKSLAVTATLLLCLMPSANAASFVDIPTKAVSVQEMLDTTSPAELDKLLFPSGMELPSKYLDFGQFTNVDGSTARVSPDTYSFLVTNFPTEDGEYTLAEVKAAQFYVGHWLTTSNGEFAMASLPFDSSTRSDIVLGDEGFPLLRDALLYFEEALEVSRVTNPEATIYNSPKFHELLEDGYSFGYDYNWDDIGVMSSSTSLRQDIIGFCASRAKYMDYFHLEVQFLEGDPYVFGATVEIPEPQDTTETPVAPAQPHETITDFKTGINSYDVPNEGKGKEDYLLEGSLIVVAFAILGGAVKWLFDRRDDPTRGWRP